MIIVAGGIKGGSGLFWAWKSRRRCGRPKADAEIRALIRQMAEQNRWGPPRIHGELLKLGFEVSQATVSRYMPKIRQDGAAANFGEALGQDKGARPVCQTFGAL